MPWAAIVLTLPAELDSLAVAASARNKTRREAWRIVSAWIAWWCFRGQVEASELGGVALWHPSGEQVDHWRPHINFIVPLRALRADGSTRDGRYQLPELALHDLRARWAAWCRAHGYRGMHAVQVHYRPRVRQPERIHAARYYGRGFPAWSAQIQRPVYHGILRSIRSLPGGEPLMWPLESRRCELCGGRWRTIAIEGPNGWVPTGGTGPPGA